MIRPRWDLGHAGWTSAVLLGSINRGLQSGSTGLREVRVSRVRSEVNPGTVCSPAAVPPDGSGMSPRWPGFQTKPTFSSPSPFPNPAHSVGEKRRHQLPLRTQLPGTVHHEGRVRYEELQHPFNHGLVVNKILRVTQSRDTLGTPQTRQREASC